MPFIQDPETKPVSHPTFGAISRDALTLHIDAFLDSRRFEDAAVTGLQVSRRDTIAHMVVGVTANKALIDAAIKAKADALLVHHGWY